MSQKINLKEVVHRIESIARDRMRNQDVVEIDSFKKRQQPKTILVIEDDPSVMRSLDRVFQKEGYKVLCAEDGTQLNQFSDLPIDFIILDIGLPWLNGYELAELLKQSKDLENIPMIFLSGQTESEAVKKGFSVGADDFVKKPFDIEQLKKTVRTLLALRE